MQPNHDDVEIRIVRARRQRRLIALSFLALLLLAVADMLSRIDIQEWWSSDMLHSLQAPAGLYLAMISILYLFWRYVRNIEDVAINGSQAAHLLIDRSATVLDAIPDALICIDENGKIIRANQYAERLLRENTGYDGGCATLKDLWKADHAFWNQPVDLTRPHTQKADICLAASLDGQVRRYEQSYQPTFTDERFTGGVWLLRDVTESLKSREREEHTQHLYQAMFDGAGVGHCVLDASCYQGDIDTLVVASINQEILNLTGAGSREQLQNEFHQLFTDGGKQLINAISRVMSQDDKRERILTTTITRFDGLERDVSLHFSNGWYGRVLVTLIDITESRRSQQNLSDEKEFWRSILSHMPVIVHVAKFGDGDQPEVLYRNTCAAEYLGFSNMPSEHMQDWLLYGDPEFRSEAREIFLRLKTTLPGQTISQQGLFKRRDGQERTIQFDYTPLKLKDDGEVETYIGIARDITEDINRQHQLWESQSHYRILADHMSDIVWTTDIDMQIDYVSPSVEHLLGYSQDEIINGAGSDIFSRATITPLLRELHKHMELAGKENAEVPALLSQHDITATAKNGQRIDLNLHVSPMWNSNGGLRGLLGVCRDITSKRMDERELKQAATVFDNSNEAILITDHHGEIIKANEAFFDLTGYTRHDIHSQNLIALLAPGTLDHVRFEEISECLRDDGYWQGEINYRCASGRLRTGWVGISLIREKHERDQTLTVIMSDITERRVIEESVHRLAYYDALTNLPNRSQMFERLESSVRQSAISDTKGALLFIDLDRFKPINDSLGHQVGDQVLQEVAARLRQCVKARDLICRMGGDEFTAVLTFPGNSELAPGNAERVAQRILKQLSAPYKLEQRSVHISASIGIALFPDDGHTATELLKNADMAMYHAKNAGRNNAKFYDDAMRQKAISQLEMVNDLHQALPAGQLSLRFQPQFDCKTKRCTSVEALLRWNHPTKGAIGPAEFIPVLEETGLINPIGQWVLEQACKHLKEWQTLNIGINRVAVNVSGAQFSDPLFLQTVQEAVSHAGLEPRQLELELTETILMKDVEHTLQQLERLRSLGFQVAIDDFGTGYSSLKYLNRFPVDKLKIDQDFVRKLPYKAESVQLVNTIITMAQNMSLGVVAEGVETCDQMSFLVESGCESVQGFLMARPMSHEQIVSQHEKLQLCCASCHEACPPSGRDETSRPS
ncbi:MAG: hypothetical protein CMI09_08015 [Oceanospirillaceae bacterium]|nr:hypothetical protein [Oceanospirillaceae bacterium]